MKKERPLAVCTRCGAYSRNLGQINQRCHVIVNRKRCKGVMHGKQRPDDWMECNSCEATGRMEGATCDLCSGEAWLLARK